MKRKTIPLLLAAALSLGAAGCAKEKPCRCAVTHSADIRLVTIKHGSCNNIHFVRYDRNATTLDILDTVFCTDFDFTQKEE